VQYIRPDNAFIFRIAHVENVAEVLARGGLYSRNADQADPNYVSIGNAELIDKRARRVVPIAPGGVLNDYVPFYFTPLSIMMLNILTGYSGVTKRAPSEIVLLVSSLHRMHELGLPFVFTNQHAYPVDTEFFDDLGDLDRIDWPLLRSRNFKTSDADPGKQVRYQAEALVHRHVPLAALRSIVCYDDAVRERMQALARAHGVEIEVKAAPSLYF
jgi:hypothetical protein